MKIRYKGGRSRYEISLNRKPYYFIPENNMTCDIKEQAVVNYIFSLNNRAEFEAVMEEVTPQVIFPTENKTTTSGVGVSKLDETFTELKPKTKKYKKHKGGKK